MKVIIFMFLKLEDIDVGGTFLKKFRIVENDNIQEYGSGGICLDKENGNLYVSSFRNVQFFKRNT